MIDKLFITPFQKFVKIESFSGILLFSATLIAVIWANSRFGYLYEALWQHKIGITIQDFELMKPLILWINDGLMTIFFFLIGLEIKREVLIGELNSLKKASFPIFAALGGMLVPLSLYLILNRNPDASQGWGIPMATDIAFSLAILKLLGHRVPLSLKVFLTAFAIVDDIGAVLIIAIFYSTGIKWGLLGIAVLLLGILAFLSYRQIHLKYLILVFGLLIWLLFLKAGIHPTVAGVLLAFTIPIRQKIDFGTFSDKLLAIVKDIKNTPDNNIPVLTREQIEKIDDLEDWTEQVQSPLQLLEHRLHNRVAYFIIPLFALSNAGVAFGQIINLDLPLVYAIAICLYGGKLIGIALMTFLGVKLKLTELPEDVNFKQILGVAFLGGVGFTMSIFITNLAFPDNIMLIDSAKAGILIGSIASGLTGYLILKLTGKKKKSA